MTSHSHLQGVSCFLPVPLTPIPPEQPTGQRCNYIVISYWGKILLKITSNMRCLFHVWFSPPLKMGPLFMIPKKPTTGKPTSTPHCHPLRSSNGKAAASSRLRGLCKELPKALRTPLRGRRFLKEQTPLSPAALGTGIPGFQLKNGCSGWQGFWTFGSFWPIVVEKPAFWFLGNFLTWQDLCELQPNKTTTDANGWRYSLDGWLELCWKSILSNMVKSGTSWRLSGGSW